MRTSIGAALIAASAIIALPVSAQDAASQVPEVPVVETTVEAAPVAAPDGYGLSREQAIEVCYPEGQQQYLARLICPDNSHPAFERRGSVGPRQPMPENMSEEKIAALLADLRKSRKREPGEPDHHIVDAYNVVCGEATTTLYLDMYHCAQDRPVFSPKGFGIID